MTSCLLKLTSSLDYKNLHRGLTALPYRDDPIGLAAAGAPKDEYEPDVSTIILLTRAQRRCAIIERYRGRHGYLPRTLAADNTYGNGELLQWLDRAVSLPSFG
jgi:hypothetical protein